MASDYVPIWLRCHDEYSRLVRYDRSSGTLTRHSLGELGAVAPSPSDVQGWFADYGTGMMLLYCSEQLLCFQAGGRDFVILPTTVVKVIGPLDDRRLTIWQNGVVVFEYRYTPPNPQMIEGDPTPFTFDEDDDFGLFVANVTSDPERIRVMCGSLGRQSPDVNGARS